MKKHTIVFYDNINGFIKLNKVETDLVNSPYLQRLRWIKQLGFSEYVFPGAVHNRLSHQIGVLHVADQMIRAIKKAVPDDLLFDEKAMDKKTKFHKSIRIAAMLHDVGHFPFSHTTEYGYLLHGNKGLKVNPEKRDLQNSHEHLGSWIIKNTDFPGGITYILKKYGFDFAEISRLVKGSSKSNLANQILHSEVDADRMDYLIRDSYHTGIRYGQIDREYILHHLTTFKADRNEVLAFKENAKYAVEDLLHARFSWYSQVIKDATGAKYDIVASHLTKYFLENKLIMSFRELLDLAKTDGEKFFAFNDFYFMNIVQQVYQSGKVKDPMIQDLLRALLFRDGPRAIKIDLFKGRIFAAKDATDKKNHLKKVNDRISEMKAVIKKHGTGKEWILTDIPEKNVRYSGSSHDLIKKRTSENVFLERDPVKIVPKGSDPILLVQMENSLSHILGDFENFIPAIYCNDRAYRVLELKNLI